MTPRENGQTRAQALYALMRTIGESITARRLSDLEDTLYTTALTRLDDGVDAGWLAKHRVRIGFRDINFYSLIDGKKPPADQRGKHYGESKRRESYPKWYEKIDKRGRAKRTPPELSKVWPSPVATSLGKRG